MNGGDLWKDIKNHWLGLSTAGKVGLAGATFGAFWIILFAVWMMIKGYPPH